MKQAAFALALAVLFTGQAARADEPAAAAPTSSGNFYTGDAKLVVVDRYAGAAVLAKPARVVVDDFAVPLDGVAIDDSLAARLHRHHQLRKGEDVDSSPAVLAEHVQAAFSDALVAELAKAHVAAGKGTTDTDAGIGAAPRLVVNGQFQNVNEGNETQRVFVGFGLGASDIAAHVTVTATTDDGPVVLLAFDVTAESNKKPGAAITSSGSLATGAAKKAFGDRKSKVEADAARMGKLVAQQIEGVMTDRKWIAEATTVAQATQAGEDNQGASSGK